MGLATRIIRDVKRRLARKRGNVGDVTVLWNAAAAPSDPNLEATYVTPVPQSGTWRAFVHYVQPTTGALRVYAEVQVGDVILDFAGDVGIPDKAEGAKFFIEGNSATYVQKPLGGELADGWDTIVEGQRITKTYLVTRQP